MSIKYYYSHRKVFALPYHDPNNLIYYLLSDVPSDEIQILKMHETNSAFGVIQLGIIGSSHFFSIAGMFCELLTCKKLKHAPDCLQIEISTENAIMHAAQFGKVNYKFNLISEIKSQEQFQQFEAIISTKNHTLILPFNEISAYTVIDIEQNYDHMLTVSTIHTYPESFTIVKTETKLFL